MQRKLRTIVEAIRVFNLKQAWKLANGMDQKKPGWKALEVLKAAILDKWGRADEADEMIQRLFTDDNDWQEETFESLQVYLGVLGIATNPFLSSSFMVNVEIGLP